VIATKRNIAARPLLIAYVLAVGFVVGILINRAPSGHAVPTLADGAAGAAETERELPDTPIWLQLFRPSQPTARWLLRMGLPILSVADGTAQEAQRRNLITYWTGQAGQQPQSFFETMLPFLRSAGEPKPPAGQPPSGPPVVTRPPETDTPAKPDDTGKTAPVAGGLPLIGIYNTHDWESYISEFPGFVAKQPDDLNKIVSQDHDKRTVMELGKALGTSLFKLGVGNVYADYTHHDLGYDYAYRSSRNTIKDILGKAPTVKVLLDIHRDSGVPGLDNTTTIAGQRVAQIRCIIGKSNPHYEQNEAFCDQLMKRLEQMHPGIALPTRVKPDNVYNQDVMPGAILLEIGTTMNQYAEAERATGYLAEALAALMRDGAYPH
jgi:stage II sporulation protein P